MRFEALGNVIRRPLPALLAAGLAMSGCSLDKVSVPELTGPAELGTSLKIQATPDALTADGFSTSAIIVTVFDNNGQGKPAVTILLDLSDAEGLRSDLGTLETTSGERLHAASATAVTDGRGVALVIYRAPARTDLTADSSVRVTVRPVGTDFNGVVDRFVEIELKSAEPRLFPQAPGNVLPVCSFVIEPAAGPFRVNEAVLFQSTASDADGTIARYEWDFGDGNKEDKPDVANVYRNAGSYTVTHICTDDDGGQGAFAATLVVN
jgi:hypothetical protein